MNDLLSEMYRGIKEKVSSPFFRYFAISYIGWNYKFLYFIFFQDEAIFEKVHGITKTDHLINGFYINEWYFMWSAIILPIFSSLFFIFVFPKINKCILKKHLENLTEDHETNSKYKILVREEQIKLANLELVENKAKKENLKINKEIDEISKKTKFSTEEQRRKEEERKVEETKKQMGSDYINITKNQYFQHIKRIINLIYDEQGYNGNIQISGDILAFFVSNRLIEKNEKGQYIFTLKGDSILSKYLSEEK